MIYYSFRIQNRKQSNGIFRINFFKILVFRGVWSCDDNVRGPDRPVVSRHCVDHTTGVLLIFGMVLAERHLQKVRDHEISDRSVRVESDRAGVFGA